MLFVRKGYAGVAMREIAEASDVTKSLIHHHFGSKQALWEEVKERAFAIYAEEQAAELEQASSADARLLRDGVVIGGLGISGVRSVQDGQIAQAGAGAL